MNQYQAFKFTGLDQDDRQRLKVAVAARMRLNGTLRRDSRHMLANKLATYIESPQTKAAPELFNWLLTYGSPRLLALAMDRVSEFSGKQQDDLKVLCGKGTHVLLPKDHILPDMQRWQSSVSPKHALICFTGMAKKLNIPVQLFHCLVAEKFDLVIYLRDPYQCLFTQGIPGIAEDINDLSRSLRSQIPSECKISIIGTSGGGYPAMAVAEFLQADRVALFSSPLFYCEEQISGMDMSLPAKNIRLYFARKHHGDVKWAKNWKSTPYKSAIRWLNTDSHGTLAYLYRSDRFEPFLRWLHDDNDNSRLLHYFRKFLPH